MIWFKACPRCKSGDLALVEDAYGKYKQCFQCGHLIYPRDQEAFPASARKSARKQDIAA